YAWFLDNSGRTTHPVGQKLPNPWGLYDMLGNAWTWCSDWYEADLGTTAVTDPTGPTTGTLRVIRGASFYDADINWYRSAYRYVGLSPASIGFGVGFRVIFVVP
ncbi:MAG: formylglycine-generating enzyme family protein, partial [Tannerellaceae bacterium]|nr:formylglycine-generating enzyme family protein [Tannerellaceae bacterium]